MTNFNDELKKVNKRAYAEVQRHFSRLAKTVHKFDPIKLLSQMTLTFLSVPANEFVEESSDTVKRMRYIEFLAGYLLSNKYPQNTKMDVDGRIIEHVANLLDKYFLSIATYLTTSPPSSESEKDLATVITHAKIHSLLLLTTSFDFQACQRKYVNVF